MKKRIYLFVNNLSEAESIFAQLLVNHISEKHIHALANEGTALGHLPEATKFQTSDIKHSIMIGLIAGSILGIIVGIAAHFVLSLEFSGLMMVTTIVGAVLGAWSSSMVGMMTPGEDHELFEKALSKNKIVIMFDTNDDQIRSLKKSVYKKFPRLFQKAVVKPILGFP